MQVRNRCDPCFVRLDGLASGHMSILSIVTRKKSAKTWRNTGYGADITGMSHKTNNRDIAMSHQYIVHLSVHTKFVS